MGAVRILKDRKCEHRPCRKVFTPERPGQKACSAPCALAAFRAKQEAAAERKRRRERRALNVAKREGRERLKNRRKRMKEAQTAFNAFVRARDELANEPCISCGLHPQAAPLRGGQWDCSHYRSGGANPELRFEESNAHRACKKCNRDLSGNIVNFRIRLREKIGPEKLEWLEGPHAPKRYTADDLVSIRNLYRVKLRELRSVCA